MRIIGLTGGVGCGKSTVANLLKTEYNARILLTDDIAKASYNIGNEGYKKVIALFGENILNCEREIDRVKLSKIVFSDNEKLDSLNKLIHPIVWDEVEKNIAMAKEDKIQFLVIESAILVEAGYKKLCDEIWYIKSNKEERIKRLLESRGYSKEKSESIINNQAKEDEYIKNSDFVLDNNGDITELKNAIDKIINSGKE